MFTDYKVPRCQGCYVNVFIDRRGIHLPYETEWPTTDSSINDWNLIQYARQHDSKALYTRIVSISQNFEVRSALFPSAKNLGRRLVELTRQLANTMNVSVSFSLHHSKTFLTRCKRTTGSQHFPHNNNEVEKQTRKQNNAQHSPASE